MVDTDNEDKEDYQSSQDTNCYTMEQSSTKCGKLMDSSMKERKKEYLMAWRLPWSSFIIT